MEGEGLLCRCPLCLVGPLPRHNPCIVDSLGNFPGSTSCSQGGVMTDREGGGGEPGPLG